MFESRGVPVRIRIASGRPAMAPPKARVVLVNADRDPIAPPSFAAAYAAHMATRLAKVGAFGGSAPQTHVVAGEGHVELIAPGSRSWELARKLIEAALGIAPRVP